MFRALAFLVLASATSLAAQARPGSSVVAALGCGGCHAGAPAPGNRAMSLATIGSTHNRDWIATYLARGSGSGARAHIPSFGFDTAEARAAASFLVDGKAGVIAQFLSLGGNRLDERTIGERIVRAQNCAGCHAGSTTAAVSAPDLSREWSRVRPEWLASYLEAPTPIRRHGVVPGSGSRMPTYAMSVADRDSVLAYLRSFDAGKTESEPAKLSAFSTVKAQTLLRDKLSCLGCHRLGTDGGEIGPELSAAGRRLRPSFIAAMIDDPQHASPGSYMPRIPMSASTRALLVSYLAVQTAAPTSSTYASLVTSPPPAPTDARGAALYVTRCAPCHGESGNGDGFNASRLPVPPARHASAPDMSARTDDRLYDGIAAGGSVLGRSARMPAFGGTLTPSEIRDLVAYIRTLCRCSGSSWSRDGQGARGEQ